MNGNDEDEGEFITKKAHISYQFCFDVFFCRKYL